MPPRSTSALTHNVFDLSGLLQNLPVSLSRHPELFSKCSVCLFSTTSTNLSKRAKKKTRKRIDPYRIAQALQRKNANLAKQQILQADRREAMGDPVRSRPTPFIESLSPSFILSSQGKYLNYFLNPSDAEAQLKQSRWLTEPLQKKDDPSHDPQQFQTRVKQHATDHDNASRAIATITALRNGSSKDLLRTNIQRCIDTFGRHNTDKFLPPKPTSAGPSSSSSHGQPAVPEDDARAEISAELASLPKRVGADTGSPEVQISILTAKINVLADKLHNKDKHNKRNLRLLVHRRQKLLNYLRRHERGGSRWQNVVEKLGIYDAMWKGEISL